MDAKPGAYQGGQAPPAYPSPQGTPMSPPVGTPMSPQPSGYSQQPSMMSPQPSGYPQQQPAYAPQPGFIPQQHTQSFHSQQQPPMGMGQQPPMNPQGQMPPQQSYRQGTNVNQQEWQASLCDCSPCSSCLLGTFLPCLLIGKTSERLRDPSMQTYEPMNSDCMIFSAIQCFTGCGWIYAMIKRQEIRERFGIQGGGCSDCCTTYWCGCCAIIQQDNEVKMRLAQGPITQGYQSPHQGGMNPQGGPGMPPKTQ